MADDDQSKPATKPAAMTEAGRVSGPAPGNDTERRAGAADVQAYIGRQLRAVYDDVAKQPIPDRFIELMKQLEAAPGRT